MFMFLHHAMIYFSVSLLYFCGSNRISEFTYRRSPSGNHSSEFTNRRFQRGKRYFDFIYGRFPSGNRPCECTYK